VSTSDHPTVVLPAGIAVPGAGRLTDDVPVALFPLRLETRFTTAGGHQYLNVRVFPDDVLIDTFSERIAQSELDNVTIYWTLRWRAGGDVSGHRAAWAQLVRAVGAGRARWLTQQVAPLNPTAEPVTTAAQYVLVIRPKTPVPAGEQTAIAAFWARVWSTAGAERDQARADLTAALGSARAAQVEAELEPVNLRDPAVTPQPSVTPVVVFLDLPDPSTLPIAAQAWNQPARAWLLPQRLVLLGFRNGAQVLSVTGAPVPAQLQVGPDPSAEASQQIRADGEDLALPDALSWMVDFDAAVAVGMAFRVDLTALGLPTSFDRLFVLGVRQGGDAATGAADLATLVRHHQASRKGFALLPQGRPTNNTDTAASGYTWWEDPQESFAHFFGTKPAEATDWAHRPDGAWLAGLLGLPAEVMRESVNYWGADQAQARAMNVALWPGTLGYYLEQLLDPVLDEQTVGQTRDFFTRFVSGRGTVPLVRVGRQPYGILPATVWSRLTWWRDPAIARGLSGGDLPSAGYLDAVHRVTQQLSDGWWRSLAAGVSHAGAAGPDPQQTLLDIVGLHPTSAEFYQRYAQSLAQHYDVLSFAGQSMADKVSAAARSYVEAALGALSQLGWNPGPGTPLPALLEKVFLAAPNLLAGDLVAPTLSERDRLPVTRGDGLNYIEWLQTAARSSHDALRTQDGFGDTPPTALLYLLLQHALDLGYVDADLALRRPTLTDQAYRALRREPSFIHIGPSSQPSRWAGLYSPLPAVTGSPTLRVGDYLPTVLTVAQPFLNRQIEALETLKTAPTAALERAMVEHLDCLSYRLDAWRMGLQAAHLSLLRRETGAGFGQAGVHIGAYGWVEGLQARPNSAQPVRLDSETAAVFQRTGDAPLVHDAGNFGHIHAPSLNQAVAAAVLRNGHLANATPSAPDLLAIDLSSKRVRWAHQIIEGIQSGQSLGALLGYRLERLLHDEPTVYLDPLITALRTAFPLAGNRNPTTQVDLGPDEITTVEASNVVDGAGFVDHVTANATKTYPYGLDLPSLPSLQTSGSPDAASIGVIIDGCVGELGEVADAVADLAVAEGVYQMVRGNYDRAAGTLDAYSKGTHPPLPEVALTPPGGHTLTHRLALHLRGGLSPDDPANPTPRGCGEPALAAWLASQIPSPTTIFARVTWHNVGADSDGTLTVTMAQLGLAPVDLFYLLDSGVARAMAGFDELLIDAAERLALPAPHHDAVFALDYRPAAVAGLTLFELAPLIGALRGLLLSARPLRPTDLATQSEANTRDDETLIVRPDQAEAVRSRLQTDSAAVVAIVGTLAAAIGDSVDTETARDAARDNIDSWISAYAAAVRDVVPYGLPTAGITAAVQARRPRLAALQATLDELITRWRSKQDDYDALLAQLPRATSDAQRTALLVQAGRVVSTGVIAPLPPSVTTLSSVVAGLRATLDAHLASLISVRADATRVGATLSALADLLPAIAAVDQTPFDLTARRDSVLALARELLTRATALRDDIQQRRDRAHDALTAAANATGDKAAAAVTQAAREILGEAFMVLPEFTVSADRLAQWASAWADRTALLAHLAPITPFPLDDWLHGLARVRPRVRDLEQAVVLAEAFGNPAAPALDALQFPYRANDAWLGLAFPATGPDGGPFTLTEDRLLYTSHSDAGAQIEPSQPTQPYCGLLLDEWAEVVPADQADTGLAFHYDRPNSEAPQAILLATPPAHTGAWQWQDLVDTLHETLDFARLRAVEPTQLGQTPFAALLPALLSSVTVHPITPSLNLAFNNNIHVMLAEGTS
jgi:hypothetical protein